MGYRIREENRPMAGKKDCSVYILENDDGSMHVEICPALGFNCFAWQALRRGKKHDLLFADPGLFKDGRPTRSGIPILFPFPGRIRGGRFSFQDKIYQLPFTDSTGIMAIHGFCCRAPWQEVHATTNFDQARLTGVFRAERDAPGDRAPWPANYELTVAYCLRRDRLRIETTVQNPDKQPLPFGLGFHPYFRIPFTAESDPAQCWIDMEASGYWELRDSLPTGNILPPDPSRDLNKPRPFTALTLDDVYTGLPTDQHFLCPRGRIHDRVAGTTLSVHSSPDFREMVLFTPGHRQAFCLEPYTCVPDAPNLQGGEAKTGWRVLGAGQAWTAVVEFVLSDLVAGGVPA